MLRNDKPLGTMKQKWVFFQLKEYPFKNWEDDGSRTHDLLNHNQTL